MASGKMKTKAALEFLRRWSKIILSASKHHAIRGGGLGAYIALAILDLACVPRTGQRRTATVVRGDR